MVNDLYSMNDSIVIWLVFALLLFWAMGAYNRLVRCRSQGIAAFAVLEALFRQYMLLVKTSEPAATGGDHATALENDVFLAAWTGLAAAADQFNASLKVAHSQPLNGSAMSALRTAFETLCVSWTRLRDLPPDVEGSAFARTLQTPWDHVSVKVDMARTDFNEVVANYNEAIAQFPALLLAWLFGFRPAQTI